MPNTKPDPSPVPPDHPVYRAAAGKGGPALAAAEHASDLACLRRTLARTAARCDQAGLTVLSAALATLDGQVESAEPDPASPLQLDHWGQLRRLIKQTADGIGLDSWQSPTISESGPAQKAPHQDPVLPFHNDYQRYAIPMQREEAALDALCDAVPGTRQRSWLFSSGMGAFATLLRALRPEETGARLVGRHLYFESAKLLAGDHPRTVTVEESDPQALLAAIAAHQPDQVFLDPLANSSELPTIALAPVIQALAALPGTRPRWLILDTTLLGAAFQPAALLKGRPWPPHLQLVTYRSLQKLDQEGLDLVTGGAVTAWTTVPFALETLRQLCGTHPTEQALLLLPFPDRRAWLAKLERHERNVRALADFLEGLRAPWLGEIRLADARQLDGHVGPLFWIEWADALNGEDAQRFLMHLLAVARERGVPMGYGTSFGFLSTRAAAFTRTGGQGTSLRIAPGTENLAQLARVADVWQAALASFGTALADAYQHDPLSEWGRGKRAWQTAWAERDWTLAALARLSHGLDEWEALWPRLGLSPELAPLQTDLRDSVVEPLKAWLGRFEGTSAQSEGTEWLDALSRLTDRLARLDDRLKPPSWWRRLF